MADERTVPATSIHLVCLTHRQDAFLVRYETAAGEEAFYLKERC